MTTKADPTLLTKEEFFARVDKAEKEIAEGKGVTFTKGTVPYHLYYLYIQKVTPPMFSKSPLELSNV